MGLFMSELISAVGHSVRIAPGERDSAIAPCSYNSGRTRPTTGMPAAPDGARKVHLGGD